MEVRVEGLRSGEGDLLVQIFAAPEGFPRDTERATQSQRIALHERSTRVVFSDLRYAVYAVAACHDENRNGVCDANLLGIPREGVGVSNDVLRRFGPPRIEDASFRLREPRCRRWQVRD